MLAVIDYGVGNLFSLSCSLAAIGQEIVVTGDPEVIKSAQRLLLPGVGAYADAARKLRETGLAHVVREEAAKGKPLLGICLGMQLLLERSFEFGEHEGLGLIPGSVRSIADVIPKGLKVPHIGWNGLHFGKDKHPLFAKAQEEDCVYFVHSYYADAAVEHVIATTDYGAEITAAVAKGNVMGCQFHPEKSGTVGLGILKSFCEGAYLK